MHGAVSAHPTFMVHLAMLGWVPVCFLLIALFGATRGVILGLVIGLFTLPNATYAFEGLPDYDKSMATSLCIAFAAACMDFRRVSRFRPGWIDLPIGILCLAPIAAAQRAGMGWWPGLSGTFEVFTTWGFSWVLGRVYLSNPAAQRFFAVCLITGSLIYVPFCLFEIRMSPILHEAVYGIRLKSFKHAPRAFGWRPNVFLEHGLMTALVMAMSALMAFWMWFCRVRRSVAGIPMGLAFVVLAMTTAATQSSNALLMLVVGIASLVFGAQRNWSWPLLLLVVFPPAYIGLRQLGGWDGEILVTAAEKVFGAGRAQSLEFRLENEQYLRDRAAEHMLTGWGEMNEFTGNVEGQKLFVTDSLWLILMGSWGLVGLCAAYAALLIGPWMLWKRLPARSWKHPLLAPLAVFAFIMVLFSLDCLLNAFPNPLFIAAGGGLCHTLGTRRGLLQLRLALT